MVIRPSLSNREDQAEMISALTKAKLRTEITVSLADLFKMETMIIEFHLDGRVLTHHYQFVATLK